jgi:peptidoglycan/LPS O-acetylase OafA/YrhL
VSAPALAHRVVFLDVFRFIAAAAVLAQHTLEEQAGLGRMLCESLSPGVFGVVLFFLISGFVIPMTAGKVFAIQTFAIRRLLRIYPLVLFAFSMAAIAGWIIDLPGFEMVRSAGFGNWLANLLLIQDYVHEEPILGVTWTLNLELAWYMLFALSFLLLGRRFDNWLVIGAPIGVLTIVMASFWLGQRLPTGRIGMIYAAIFGCRAYYYFEGEVDLCSLMRDAIVFVFVMTFSNVVSFGYYSHPKITMMQSVVPWLVAPTLFLLVTSIPSVNRSKFFKTPVLAWLGTISFSIYLLHPLALAIARAYSPPGAWIAVGLALTLLFSMTAFRWVEMPGQALARQLTGSSRTRDQHERARSVASA